jgi:MFS family permease
VIPAVIAIAVLLIALREPPRHVTVGAPQLRFLRGEVARFPRAFWWAIMIASLLSLARCSQAFLVLKAYDIGIDAAFVPIILIVVHLAYASAAYPFGVLADRMDRRTQLGIGAAVLICADVILAGAYAVWMVALGAALWGLQMAVTQGLLSASVANAAPEHLRGTAFGTYELAVGLATFAASAAAGAFWMIGGSVLTFGASAMVAALAALVLLLGPMPKPVRLPS